MARSFDYQQNPSQHPLGGALTSGTRERDHLFGRSRGMIGSDEVTEIHGSLDLARIRADEVLCGFGSTQQRPEIVPSGEQTCRAAVTARFPHVRTIEQVRAKLGEEYVSGFIDGWDYQQAQPERSWTPRYLQGVRDGVAALESCMHVWSAEPRER